MACLVFGYSYRRRGHHVYLGNRAKVVDFHPSGYGFQELAETIMLTDGNLHHQRQGHGHIPVSQLESAWYRIAGGKDDEGAPWLDTHVHKDQAMAVISIKRRVR